jgi:hypothetical protein
MKRPTVLLLAGFVIFVATMLLLPGLAQLIAEGGEVAIWRSLCALLVIAAFGVAAIPGLAVWAGRALVGHGEAMAAAYRAYSETYRAAIVRQAERV